MQAAMLASLRHPNCVLFLGLVLDPPTCTAMMVTELMACSAADLAWGIYSFANALQPWAVRLRLLGQCSLGMSYLHSLSPPLLHQDLKSLNLLLDSKTDPRVCKICDFGLAHQREDSATASTLGTPQWSAPEVLRQDHFSKAADVWSFGVIMWEFAMRQQPFADMRPIRVAHEVAYKGLVLPVPTERAVGGDKPSIDYADTGELPVGLGSLMQECFDAEPQQRPSFDEITARLHNCLATIKH